MLTAPPHILKLFQFHVSCHYIGKRIILLQGFVQVSPMIIIAIILYLETENCDSPDPNETTPPPRVTQPAQSKLKYSL